MTALSKKAIKIADIYVNAYHGAIKIKPAGVQVNTYIDFDAGKHDKEPEFKAGDHVSVSKNKNVFAKKYTPNCSEVFVIKNVKGATKSYFTLYSCMVIVLFNTALCRSAFSTVSFRKLVFGLSVLSLNQDIKICVIMLCNFDM